MNTRELFPHHLIHVEKTKHEIRVVEVWPKRGRVRKVVIVADGVKITYGILKGKLEPKEEGSRLLPTEVYREMRRRAIQILKRKSKAEVLENFGQRTLFPRLDASKYYKRKKQRIYIRLIKGAGGNKNSEG